MNCTKKTSLLRLCVFVLSLLSALIPGALAAPISIGGTVIVQCKDLVYNSSLSVPVCGTRTVRMVQSGCTDFENGRHYTYYKLTTTWKIFHSTYQGWNTSSPTFPNEEADTGITISLTKADPCGGSCRVSVSTPRGSHTCSGCLACDGGGQSVDCTGHPDGRNVECQSTNLVFFPLNPIILNTTLQEPTPDPTPELTLPPTQTAPTPEPSPKQTQIDEGNDGDDGGIGVGAVVGIVVGALAVGLGLVVTTCRLRGHKGVKNDREEGVSDAAIADEEAIAMPMAEPMEFDQHGAAPATGDKFNVVPESLQPALVPAIAMDQAFAPNFKDQTRTVLFGPAPPTRAANNTAPPPPSSFYPDNPTRQSCDIPTPRADPPTPRADPPTS